MMRHLSLFSGYGGIDVALEAAWGTTTVAVADVDPGACKVLTHRYPGVPNLGDVTTVDWSQWVGKVDVISGGSPCQDLSHAGRRAGMTTGTRSNLWVAMREAIATIKPALVVWENVRGAYSAAADSALEPCPGCVGGGDDGEPVLRALGRVLGDFSDLGYDTFWYGLRASDVGAAHHRFRVFVFAYLPDALGSGLRGWAPDTQRGTVGRTPVAGGGEVPGRMMPTPAVDRRDNRSASPGAALRPGLESIATMLPTPDAYEATRGGSQHPDKRREGGHSPYLASVIEHALPTPRATDGTKGGPGQRGSSGDLMLPSAVQDWREYEPAIRRQEAAFGMPAPLPTKPGRAGKPRLSAAFSEWLMGLPAGWITSVPGVTHNEALKLAGNGVVPQQCLAAATAFAHDLAALEVAA